MKHRKPPTPHWNSPPGRCRWCGEPVVKKGKPSFGRWHPDCVKAYQIAAWPNETRKAVFARDKGICVKCGLDTCDPVHHRDLIEKHGWQNHTDAWLRHWLSSRRSGAGIRWQADHIVELKDCERDITMWSLGNLQTLCTACHLHKSTESRRARKKTP